MGVYDAVTSQFTQANSYAKSAWSTASSFLTTLLKAVETEEVDPSVLDFEFTPVSDELIRADKPSDVSVGTIDRSRYPSRPNLDSVTGISTSGIPTNTVPQISITEPEKPVVVDPRDPGNPEPAQSISIPGAPVLNFPVEPSINTTFQLPDKPNITIPSFTALMPVDTLTAPENTFSFSESEYQSDLMTALKAKLLSDLEAGGTGLGADAEAAIWQRAQDRQAEVDEKLYTETMTFFSSRGWSLPSGALSAKLAEAHNESRRSSEKLNADILIQQSQLTYQNIKDTIQAIIALEQSLLQHADAVASRGLEAARYTVDAAVNVFNAKVARLGIAWEGYKAAASVYETNARVQSLLVEMYNSELAGVKIESEIELTKLEVWKGQLAAVAQRVDVYKAELEGAAIAAEIERLKLEEFKSRVDIFTAKINANTAKYNMYQAEWAGQATKAQVYSEQIRGFATEVEAAKVRADILAKNADITIAANENRVKVYAADIEAYKADLSGQSTYVDALVKVYGAKAGMYDSDIRKAVAAAESNIKANQANLVALQGKLELELKQAEVNIRNAQETNQLRLEAARAGAAVTAQMAAGALSSANANASVTGGYHESYDKTKSEATHSYQYITTNN